MTKNSRYRADYREDERVSLEIERDDRVPICFSDKVAMNIPMEYIATQPDQDFNMVFFQADDGKIIRKYYEDAMARGYQPVYRSEHSSLRRNSIVAPWGKEAEDDQQMYIVDGHVATKRSKKISEQEYIYFNKKANAQDWSARQFEQLGDEQMQVWMDQKQEPGILY